MFTGLQSKITFDPDIESILNLICDQFQMQYRLVSIFCFFIIFKIRAIYPPFAYYRQNMKKETSTREIPDKREIFSFM